SRSSSYRSDPPRHLPSFPTRRSSDLRTGGEPCLPARAEFAQREAVNASLASPREVGHRPRVRAGRRHPRDGRRTRSRRPRLGCRDRKSTRLNSSHVSMSYAVFCFKKKTKYHLSSSIIVCSPSGPASWLAFFQPAPAIKPLVAPRSFYLLVQV